MAHYDISRPAPFGAITAYKLVNFFGDVVARISAWNAARKTEQALNELSDEMLADIGLYRGQVTEISHRMTHLR